ncbi:MGMT family protein [Cellvibrio polysaccharolyticus]|uniref:Cysteine methyltransferase n=1 Tax=Cellvibrio polysaccharolyticus TaxID=2082724 RepID=A0A928YVB8_9GAMM|nr:MGMT family protein [Cellvibrio polysaccharolyticus]MBE8718380.1 cysteine methyltransferase [Cellvibrio polysaccharolyticus]
MTNIASREAIWLALSQIPPGKVVTYGELARMANLPRAARLAGTVLKQLPENSQLPWHRVINAQGKLSLPASTPAGKEQARRLTAEGVIISAGKVSLAQFGWLR